MSKETWQAKAPAPPLKPDLGAHQHRSPAGIGDVGTEGGRVVHGRYRVAEVAVIPQIDPVTTQLELPTLRESHGLHQAEIPVLETRPAEGVSPERAAARHGVGEGRSG